ncbi:hypothetical protein [Pyrococcus sp. ST04]|uniref:hypothetical protein n=1 Tax=Pyrococcus sp. ST04 TaxID=1183377 RepID=UPI00064F89AE|nr:hypothetical protein [Pyrococcus sp. ST04]
MRAGKGLHPMLAFSFILVGIYIGWDIMNRLNWTMGFIVTGVTLFSLLVLITRGAQRRDVLSLSIVAFIMPTFPVLVNGGLMGFIASLLITAGTVVVFIWVREVAYDNKKVWTIFKTIFLLAAGFFLLQGSPQSVIQSLVVGIFTTGIILIIVIILRKT